MFVESSIASFVGGDSLDPVSVMEFTGIRTCFHKAENLGYCGGRPGRGGSMVVWKGRLEHVFATLVETLERREKYPGR